MLGMRILWLDAFAMSTKENLVSSLSTIFVSTEERIRGSLVYDSDNMYYINKQFIHELENESESYGDCVGLVWYRPAR